MNVKSKQVSPVYRATQVLVGLFGILIAWAMVFNTFKTVTDSGSTEREGKAKVDAALEELDRVQQKQN